ncbi:hypothetical protein KJZ67_05050 [Patescibacteria group bacterium]|nr:hypothetical protein [Patescibacteria group bacterium]
MNRRAEQLHEDIGLDNGVGSFMKPAILESAWSRTGGRRGGLRRNSRSGGSGGGGALPQPHDPNIDLNKIDPLTRKKIEEEMGRVHNDGRDSSMRVYRIRDRSGKIRTIIDL